MQDATPLISKGNLNSAPCLNLNIPQPRGHSVQFYEEDGSLLRELSQFIGAALGGGGSAIVIATQTHREALASQLEQQGIHLQLATKNGRFLSLDAAEALSGFMVDGMPDADLFNTMLGSVVAQMSGAANARGHRLAAFGEMVALLWAEGNRDAAIYLEKLWNQLGERYAFHLHCAYPRKLVSDGNDYHIADICSRH